MLTFLLILFVMACIVLIVSVLLQSGKGGGIGEIFGGGGGEHALFGSKGAGGFMVKITIGAAIVFMATALLLAVLTSRQGRMRPITPSSPAMPVEEPVGGNQAAPSTPAEGK